MEPIQFEKRIVTAVIRNPMKNFNESKETIEIRTDPLTRRNCRISSPKGLDKTPPDNPLEVFAGQSASCFFCEGRVENQTPMLPESILAEGRITSGNALLFPNLSGFGKYSAVCIFSKKHFTPIDQFDSKLIFHTLDASRKYFNLCVSADKEILYPTINFNYLLPAGSSILHPHIQPFLDPVATNLHRQLIDSSNLFYHQHKLSFWESLKEAEGSGPRFLFESAGTFWYTPFAPTGFNEVNGIIGNGEAFTELSDDLLWELADGIEKVLSFYHSIRHDSLNLTLFSPAENEDAKAGGIPCLVKIVTRPVFMPHYRSDVTFFEKFHDETMIDKSPEEVASDIKNHLNNLPG